MSMLVEFDYHSFNPRQLVYSLCLRINETLNFIAVLVIAGRLLARSWGESLRCL